MIDTSDTAPFTVACVQMRGGREMAANVEVADSLVREAASAGADLVVTPEQTGIMELERKALFEQITEEDSDPTLIRLRATAAEVGCHVVIGSLAIKTGRDTAASRQFVIGPEGNILATYDKIHMFDVDLPGGESYRESRSYQAGNRAVVVDLPWGRFGLSICYDLRFPALYRSMAMAGAGFLLVPSAFTKVTGEAHWHTLIRARAIENACFVIAATQGGLHENGRETYGHGLVVSPWGEVLAEAGNEPGVIVAEIDPNAIAEARHRIPALRHDRPFEVAALPSGHQTERAVS